MYLMCLVCILFVKKIKMLGGICDKNLSVLNDDLNSYLIIERFIFWRRVRKYIKDMF